MIPFNIIYATYYTTFKSKSIRYDFYRDLKSLSQLNNVDIRVTPKSSLLTSFVD